MPKKHTIFIVWRRNLNEKFAMYLILHIYFLSWLIQTDWIPYDFHKYHEYFTQYISIYLLSALFPHISVLSYHLWLLSQTDGIPEAGLTQDYFRGRIVRAGASQGLPCTVSGHTSNTDTNKDIQTQIYQCEYTNTRDKHTETNTQIHIQTHWRRLISEDVWGLPCTVSMSYKQLLMNESLQTSGHYSLARWRVVYVYQFHNTSKIRFTCRCR